MARRCSASRWQYQGFAVVPDRQRADQYEADVLHPRLVHLVFRANDRRGDAVPFRQSDGGISTSDLSVGGMDFRAALECLLDHYLLVDRRNIWWQGKLAQRLDRAGLFGDSDLVAQVGERRQVILAGCLDQLPGCPALDASQCDIGRLDLVGLHALLKRFGKAIIEVSQFPRQAILFAAIRGRLEKPIGLNESQQLRLNNNPLLLVEGGFGDVITMSCLMAQLDRLTKRDVNVVLAVMIIARVTAGGTSARACRTERAIGDKGDRSIINPDCRVECGWKMSGNLDGLGRGCQGVALPQGHEIGVAGDRAVERGLQTDRLTAGRRYRQGTQRRVRRLQWARSRRQRARSCRSSSSEPDALVNPRASCSPRPATSLSDRAPVPPTAAGLVPGPRLATALGR